MSTQLGLVFMSATVTAVFPAAVDGHTSGWALKYREQVNLLTP